MDTSTDVKAFVVKLLDIPPSAVNVAYAGSIATWTLNVESSVKRSSVSNTTTHGTARAMASELIDDALNGRTPTIYDQLDKDTYAEIKAIASGNPAVMEKVRVDTEIRKLDQLRSSHQNQQYSIRWQIKSLPDQIKRSHDFHAAVSSDIKTRDQHSTEEFTMQVGRRSFSGKGAREDAGDALRTVVMSWREDKSLKQRGHYRGFEVLSRGGSFKDSDPEVFIRGAATYKANFNPETPAGVIRSMDYILQHLEERATEVAHEFGSLEKSLADYRVQLGRKFEHEERLQELMIKQAQLNASLDLDKSDRQLVPEPLEKGAEVSSTSFVERIHSEVSVSAMAI